MEYQSPRNGKPHPSIHRQPHPPPLTTPPPPTTLGTYLPKIQRNRSSESRKPRISGHPPITTSELIAFILHRLVILAGRQGAREEKKSSFQLQPHHYTTLCIGLQKKLITAPTLPHHHIFLASPPAIPLSQPPSTNSHYRTPLVNGYRAKPASLNHDATLSRPGIPTTTTICREG